jgi:hypothetical protein
MRQRAISDCLSDGTSFIYSQHPSSKFSWASSEARGAGVGQLNGARWARARQGGLRPLDPHAPRHRRTVHPQPLRGSQPDRRPAHAPPQSAHPHPAGTGAPSTARNTSWAAPRPGFPTGWSASRSPQCGPTHGAPSAACRTSPKERPTRNTPAPSSWPSRPRRLPRPPAANTG